MTNSSPNQGLGQGERLLLVLLAVLLATGLLWFRGGLHPAAPLERLARQSLDLPVALGNGKPTVVEFYADWCEACRSMAPAMETVEAQHRGKLDVVLLNVDNPRWQPELERYDVNGIPQLELFNAAGVAVGRSIGARSTAELQELAGALIAGTPLPALAGVGAVSSLEPAEADAATMAGPRSHS
ncbi:MAG: thioredoxin domain-containing protein [Cyanobium sp.]